jgi:hypothetical protein
MKQPRTIALVAGTTMFLATERRDWRQFGRILVGIGLLVLSLQMIGHASEPLRDSKLLPVIVDYFSGDPVTAYLLAALTTWLFHSEEARSRSRVHRRGMARARRIPRLGAGQCAPRLQRADLARP